MPCLALACPGPAMPCPDRPFRITVHCDRLSGPQCNAWPPPSQLPPDPSSVASPSDPRAPLRPRLVGSPLGHRQTESVYVRIFSLPLPPLLTRPRSNLSGRNVPSFYPRPVLTSLLLLLPFRRLLFPSLLLVDIVLYIRSLRTTPYAHTHITHPAHQSAEQLSPGLNCSLVFEFV